MKLTQALIERAHSAAVWASGIWYVPSKEKVNQAAYKTYKIVAYDRAYDVAIGKDRK